MRLAFSSGKIESLTGSLVALVFRYGWDYKITPIQSQYPNIVGLNPVTGARGPFVDCSGFSRWVVWHASQSVNPNPILIPDGSVAQHEWALANLVPCNTSDGHALDGLVRVAFLAPRNGSPGHVMLIRDNVCYESHGSSGPSMNRLWGSQPFMGLCNVFELAQEG